MRSVCFIRKQIHTVSVCKVCNSLDIRADSVIGGVVYENRLCVGVFLYRLFKRSSTHSQRIDLVKYRTFPPFFFGHGYDLLSNSVYSFDKSPVLCKNSTTMITGQTRRTITM